MNSYEYCEKKISESHSNFMTGFRFLQLRPRRALVSIYAFCREIDDIVDEPHEPEMAKIQLKNWHHLIDDLAHRKTSQTKCVSLHKSHPLYEALSETLDHYPIPTQYFHELIEGMELDLQFTQYPDRKSLEVYCYHVAGVVGIITAHILGFTSPETLTFATELGIALQLINIIRDVSEDASRGRIYIPMDECKQFGISTQALLSQTIHHDDDAFIALMTHQASQAKAHYHRALALLPAVDRKSQQVSLVMGAIYFALLQKIEQQRFSIFDNRIKLSHFEKLRVATKVFHDSQ